MTNPLFPVPDPSELKSFMINVKIPGSTRLVPYKAKQYLVDQGTLLVELATGKRVVYAQGQWLMVTEPE